MARSTELLPETDSLGGRLLHLREEKELTRRALAFCLKCHESSVTEWESGRHTPGIGAIIAYSDFFGVSTDWILKGERHGRKA